MIRHQFIFHNNMFILIELVAGMKELRNIIDLLQKNVTSIKWLKTPGTQSSLLAKHCHMHMRTWLD